MANDFDVSQVNVDAPVNINLPEGQSYTFIDSIKGVFDNYVERLKDLDDEALTGIYMALLFGVTFIVIWRTS